MTDTRTQRHGFSVNCVYVYIPVIINKAYDEREEKKKFQQSQFFFFFFFLIYIIRCTKVCSFSFCVLSC